MKDYIERKIAIIRGEKEFWLGRLEKNENDEYARTEYLIKYDVLKELLEIEEVMNGDDKIEKR